MNAPPHPDAPRRILFLAANPDETTRLNLEKEMREVRVALERGGRRELFTLQIETAVRIGELQHLLDVAKPAIVHFGGHGSDSREQIILLDAHDNAIPVAIEPLADLLGTRDGVLLNACSSAHQAEEIARRGAWAVGMSGPIKTGHAVVFAQTFYGKLADGSSVEEAFKGAKLQLALEGHTETAQLPRLYPGRPAASEISRPGEARAIPKHGLDAAPRANVDRPRHMTPDAPAAIATAAAADRADFTRPGSRSSSSQLHAILNPFGDGDVAAETQILSELYFDDTDFPKKALSDKTNLIIGRRGAGKSALAQWLGLPREASARHYAVYVNISNLPLFAPIVTGLADKLRGEHHGAETLSAAWKIALLHALMVETLKDRHLSGRSGSLDMDSHLITRSIPKTQTASHVIQRVFQIILNSLVASISNAASIMSSVQQLEDSPGFVAWRKALPEYLKASKRRAVVVIDTLEEYRIKEQAVQLSMASLSHAVTELSKGGAGDGVEFKLFFPAEVVQSLEDTAILNIGKTFDRALFMHWRRKDLLRLVCWRLMYHLSSKYPDYCPAELRRYQNLDWSDHSAIEEHVWDRFFAEANVGGRAVSSFAYISRFTQLRPRQFVLLCNAIAQKSHEARAFPQVRWMDIGAGIAEVVDTLAREVLSSFRDVHGEIDRIVGTLTTLRDSQSLYLGLTYGNVDALASQVKGICSHEDFWRLLLETGVLGVVTRETEIYTEARFEYIVRQRLSPNVHDRFVVHPMYYGRLSVRPPLDAKPVFPIGPEDLTIDY